MQTFDDEKFILQRSPRILSKSPAGVIEIEPPTAMNGKPSMNVVAYLLPLIGSVTLAIVSSIVMKSTTTLILAVGGAVVAFFSTVIVFFHNLRRHSGQSKAQQKKYLYYLNTICQRLEGARSEQREVNLQLHPALAECIEIVRQARKQLWEKTIIEPDFLHIRLGIGKQPMLLKAIAPKPGRVFDEENPLYARASQLAEGMGFVDEAPIAVQLLDTSTIGIAGNEESRSEFLSACLVHLTSHHGYDDVKLVAVMSEEQKTQWDWIRWLPHCWDEERKGRYIAVGTYEAARLAEELLPKLKMREPSKTGIPSKQTRLPHYVILILDQQLWAQNELLSYLLANETCYGATSIFLSERIDLGLPLNCQTVIEVDAEHGIIRKNTASKLDEMSHRFRADLLQRETAEQFARQLAPYRIRQANAAAKLPSSLSFLEAFGVRLVEELQVSERWRSNQANRLLAVPLGIGANGTMLLFDLHEKAHGPHGLVAGTTGAGKSELLLSLLLALAVDYHPHEVSFVIIDYKGGGMANTLQGLPHLLGTLTNLEGNGINRALASFHSEIQRRQKLFANAGVAHIDDYIVHYRQGKIVEALPHLIVVVDEFAELKQNQPEFMRQLVSAARVGRSLGIHLILATQKPSGVVDEQIWSNARFKLCLKVQTASDSHEMLKRPEAADIREKGRGYLQVGNNEIFTLFQSAWSGAPYVSQVEDERPQAAALFHVQLNGQRSPPVGAASKRKESLERTITQLEAVIGHISDAARTVGVRPLTPLWLPPLPTRLLLGELRSNHEGWDGRGWPPAKTYMLAAVGLVDDPAQQAQFELQADLGQEGHLLVYGAPGSGKTTLLKSIITSLALRYDPSSVHFYVLDFGTRTLGVFQQLPHVAEVIFPEDEEKLRRLFALIQSEMEQRKRKFSVLGISNLQEYRLAADDSIASLVIVLDNFANFNESYSELIGSVVSFVREGGNYGIHFVATANASNSVPYRITQNVKMTYVLQMADTSDYSALVGRTEGLIPEKMPGRGLIKHSPPLEFQTSLPFEGQHEAEISSKIRELCAEMRSHWHRKPVESLLQEAAPIRIAEFHAMIALTESPSFVVPLGVAADDGTPKLLTLDRHHSCLISAIGKETIRTGVFATIMESIVAGNGRAELHLIDTELSMEGWKQHESVRNYITDSAHLLEVTRSAIEQLQLRKKEVREAVPSGLPEEELAYMYSRYPTLVFCMPDLWAAVNGMENESRDQLERITRHGAGLGVFVLAAADAGQVARLQLLDPLTRALIARRASIVLGGACKDHAAVAEGHGLPSSLSNRLLHDDEAVLLTDGEQSLIRVPIRQ